MLLLTIILTFALINGGNGFGSVDIAYGQTADLQTVLDYCFAHADRVAKGENVILDLVNAGLIDDIGHWTCKDVAEEKERIENVTKLKLQVAKYTECMDNFYALHKEYILADKKLREHVCTQESK